MASAERQARYRERYPERVKAYYVNNRERVLEQSRRWRRDNPEAKAAQWRRWAAANPDIAHALVARKSGRRRGCAMSVTAADIRNMWTRQDGCCAYCARKLVRPFHVEHPTPLSRGGKDDAGNRCLSCPNCNSQKHNKTAEEFIEARRRA